MKMKPLIAVSAVLAVVATSRLSAQAPGAPGAPATPPVVAEEINAKFGSQDDRNGYVLGAMIADDMVNRIRRLGYDAPDEAIARGFTEWVLKKSVVDKDQVRQVFAAIQYEVNQKAEAKRKEEAEKNKSEGERFLAENKAKEGVVTLPSGLQYKVLTPGTGQKPGPADTVVCQYRGTLIDGTEFDSSYGRGQPARFAVNRVIRGWTEALQLMPIGSKWQLFIPSNLAYGEAGSPPKIGPNATLLFEIELQGIQGTAGTPAAGGQPVVTSDIIKVPSKAELEKGAKIEVIKADEVEKLKQEAASKPAGQ